MNLKPTIIKLISRVLLGSFSMGILLEAEWLTAQTGPKPVNKPVPAARVPAKRVNRKLKNSSKKLNSQLTVKTFSAPIITSSGPTVPANQVVSVAALQQRTNMLNSMQKILTPYLATYNTKTPMMGAGAGAWYYLQAAISTGNLLPGGQSIPSFKLADGTTVIPTTLFGLLGKQLMAYSYAGLYNSMYSLPKSKLPQLDPNYQLLAGLMYFGDGSGVNIGAYGYPGNIVAYGAPGNDDQLPPLDQSWSTNATTATAQQAMASFFQPGASASVARYEFQPFQPLPAAGADPNFQDPKTGSLSSGILKKTGPFCAALDTAYGLPNTAITVGAGATQTQTTLGAYLNPGCGDTSGIACTTGTAWLGATCVSINDCCQNAYGQSKGYGSAGVNTVPAGATGYVDCIKPVAQLPYGAAGFPDPQDSSGKTMIKYGICDIVPAPAPQNNCGAQAGDQCGTIPTANCCAPGLVPIVSVPSVPAGSKQQPNCNCLIPVGSTLSCQGNSALCAPSGTAGVTVACVANVCTETVPVQTCALFQASCSPSSSEISQTCCSGNNLICDTVSKICLGDTGYICNGSDSNCASGYSCDAKTKQCVPASCDSSKLAVAPGVTCLVSATAACCANTVATASAPASNFVCGLSGNNTHICCSNDGKTYLTATDQAKCCADATLTQIAGTNDYVCAPNTPKPLPTPSAAPGPNSDHVLSSLDWSLIGGAAALSILLGVGATIAYARYNQHRYIAAYETNRQAGMATFSFENTNWAAPGSTDQAKTDLQVAAARFGVTAAFKAKICAGDTVFRSELLSAPRSLTLGAGNEGCPDCEVEVTSNPDGTVEAGSLEALAPELAAAIDVWVNAGGSGDPLISAADAQMLADAIAKIPQPPANSGGWKIGNFGTNNSGDPLALDTGHAIARAYALRRILRPDEKVSDSLEALFGDNISSASKLLLENYPDEAQSLAIKIFAQATQTSDPEFINITDVFMNSLDAGRKALVMTLAGVGNMTDFGNLTKCKQAWQGLVDNFGDFTDDDGDPLFANQPEGGPSPSFSELPPDLFFGPPE